MTFIVSNINLEKYLLYLQRDFRMKNLSISSLFIRKKNLMFVQFLLLIIILVTACSNEKIESQWMTSPITVDGSGEDWSEYRQLFNEDWKIMYSTVNDDTSISLIMQFRDHQLARKINTRGLTLWLNSNGEEKKNVGIHYEDSKLMNKILNDLADGKRITKPDNRNLEMNKAIALTGTFAVVDKDKNIISSTWQNGIYAKAQYNQGNYCFEYKIEFESNINDILDFTISPDNAINFGIEIAAVSEEFKEIMQQKMADKMKSGQRPSGGMSGGGRSGGGMRGGGMKSGGRMGGSPGGNRDNMMNDLDAQEIWTTVVLANQ